MVNGIRLKIMIMFFDLYLNSLSFAFRCLSRMYCFSISKVLGLHACFFWGGKFYPKHTHSNHILLNQNLGVCNLHLALNLLSH